MAVAAADPQRDYPGFDEELATLGRAVPKRRREFRAGRWAARAALSELGIAEAPLPVAADRSPVWPAGVLGSITHTDSACLAVVARDSALPLLGVDLEPDQPLMTGLVDTICVAEEQQWLATQSNPTALARVLFSAKESVYKALSPRMRTVIGFDAVAIQLRLEQGDFQARLQYPVPGFAAGYELRGRVAVAAGLILTVVLDGGQPAAGQ